MIIKEHHMFGKNILLLIGLLIVNANLYCAKPSSSPKAPLTSPVLRLIDGFIIDKEYIGFMLQLRLSVHNLQKGAIVQNKTGTPKDYKYSFNGTKYSIQQLAQLEQQDSTIVHSHDYQRALTEAKEDFVTIMLKFVAYSAGSKSQVLELMEESCRKHGRSDSLLIRWGQAKEGTEAAQFRKDITNFTMYDVFCTDLVTFLEDFIYSCPVAYKQFEEDYKKKQQAGVRR